MKDTFTEHDLDVLVAKAEYAGRARGKDTFLSDCYGFGDGCDACRAEEELDEYYSELRRKLNKLGLLAQR